jgi:hypothetical protein
MTVAELIEKLKAYNQDADVLVGANDTGYATLNLSYGTSEGCTPATADCVFINVMALNSPNEKELLP